MTLDEIAVEIDALGSGDADDWARILWDRCRDSQAGAAAINELYKQACSERSALTAELAQMKQRLAEFNKWLAFIAEEYEGASKADTALAARSRLRDLGLI